MTSKQSAIQSGFRASTSAAQVLEGRDLSNVTAIVTGGHSELRLETTRALASAGVRIIVAARDPEAARIEVAGIESIETDRLDLADLASVRDFAGRFLATGRHLDILIGSAGIMACPETRMGSDWEAQFATDHLGHYLLVNLLWPALKGGARVIAVSSAGHHHSGIRWDDVQFMRGYDKWLAYGQSKTANALFAVHLDRLSQNEDVRAFPPSWQDFQPAPASSNAWRNDYCRLARRQWKSRRSDFQNDAAGSGDPGMDRNVSAVRRYWVVCTARIARLLK